MRYTRIWAEAPKLLADKSPILEAFILQTDEAQLNAIDSKIVEMDLLTTS